MKIINAYTEILDKIDGEEILKRLELAGRVCYKSEDKITPESDRAFVKRMIDSQHESVLEHEKVSIRVVCDRGVSHEWVRHRIASYSQESTRYCNYCKDKFDNQITFIKPCFWDESNNQFLIWKYAMEVSEKVYTHLLENGATPQEARTVLPNSLKTELVVTFNLREWRHFFKLRTSTKSHPQMRELSIPLLEKFKTLIPIIFDDIQY